MTNHCEQIAQQIVKLFSCEKRDFGTLVRTPLVRPDGDFVEVVVRQEVQGAMVTDLGETLRWLGNVGGTVPADSRVESVLAAHAAMFIDGQVYVRTMPGEDLAAAVLRAAQACVDFSALLYSQRARPERRFELEVRQRVAAWNLPFDDLSVKGASGMTWRVAKAGNVHTKFRLVRSLSSKQRTYAQNLAITTRCMWDDLNDLRKNRTTGYEEYVTILDDFTPELWRETEIKLLEKASKVVLWSQQQLVSTALGVASLGA